MSCSSTLRLVTPTRALGLILRYLQQPELLIEVDAWTGFTSAFTYVGTGEARMSDLGLSVIAVLVAEACNVGLVPVLAPDVAAARRVHGARGRACSASDQLAGSFFE